MKIKLNKEEIIFHPVKDADSLTGYKECDYCGISQFSHRHTPNTLRNDFERIDELRGFRPDKIIIDAQTRGFFCDKHGKDYYEKDSDHCKKCLNQKEYPNCLRCGKDISNRQLRLDGIIYCHRCEERLKILKDDLEFLQELKGGREQALKFSARMIKDKQQLNDIQ